MPEARFQHDPPPHGTDRREPDEVLPDEVLMAMALHSLPDPRAVRHIERREQGGCAIARAIMGHLAEGVFPTRGGSAALLQRPGFRDWPGRVLPRA